MRTEKGIDIDIDRDGWGAMVRKRLRCRERACELRAACATSLSFSTSLQRRGLLHLTACAICSRAVTRPAIGAREVLLRFSAACCTSQRAQGKRRQTEDTKMTMGERGQTILDQYTVECANGKGKRGEPALAPCDGNCSSTMVMPQSGNHHCVLCAHGGPLGSATSEQGFRVLVCSSSCIC